MQLTKKTGFQKWSEKLPFDERLTHARQSLKGASDIAHFLVDTHAANRIILYSDALSKQVGRSYATNAYNNFTRALLEIEFVRLCSLWDPPERDAFSIPTVVGLFDNGECIECVAREGAAHFDNFSHEIISKEKYTEEQRKMIREASQRMARRDAQEEYIKIWRRSMNTIYLSRLVADSKMLNNVRNFRNKYIAHGTEMTREERKNGPIALPKMGDERKLLRITLKILQRLDFCVRGTSFNWTDSERIARKNAEALWHGVTIKPLR